jgi:chitodextrinase
MTKKIVILSLVIFSLLLTSSTVSAFVELHLPSTPVTMNASYPSSQSYFDTILSNVSVGYDVQNGSYIDWCAAKEIYINPNHEYTNTHLYSIYNTSMPGYLWHANWTKINYLLNHKIPNVDWKQIQYAIWYLLDYGNAGLDTDGWSMVHNASLYGENYTPTYFDIIGVIADANQTIQKQLLEIQPIDPIGDADGDGVPNIEEDVNDDGNPHNDDSDSDGLSNYLDPDDDDDTIPTCIEISDGNQYGQDVDTDGTPNYLDTDSDGDGLMDYEEGTGDHDGDGIPNYLDPEDRQAPSKVENLTASDAKDGKILLTWDPAVDNVGVDHYEIYQDGSFLANITNTSYLDTGLINGHSYTYTVRAVDTAENKGNFSDPAVGKPTKTRSSSSSHSTSQSSTPTNTAPIANTSAGEPYTGNVNETILFNASASYDPDHDTLSYHWDFGDGTTSTLEIAPHVYLTFGVYNVTLMVTDSHGATDSDTTIAVVIKTNTSLSQPILIGPTEGFVNILYNFRILINESDAIRKIIVDWGDGQSLTNNQTTGSVFEINHLWAQPGQYTINVTTSDGNSTASTKRTMDIYQPMIPENTPESNNILLLLLALLTLALLAYFYLLGKQKKDDK